MISEEENNRLTRVGPGTPAGELLRRYWHPVAAAIELKEKPTKRLRILGEDLALYKDREGRYGLLAEHCSHRRCSLAFGIPEFEGLRCAYHGWLYDREGNCLEQPSEASTSKFKDQIKHPAYPVEELGGLLFAYMGPKPTPLLPRFDYFVQGNSLRQVGITNIPANWLQIMENSMDPIHVEWLHAYYRRYLQGDLRERGAKFPQRRHIKIGFDLFEFGIIKRRLYEGGAEEDGEWRIGHPVVFPTTLKFGDQYQVRTPIDDENSLVFWYDCFNVEGVIAPAQLEVPMYELPWADENGQVVADDVARQDTMAWITQGTIADRTLENLAGTDQGVLFYRKFLDEQIKLVESHQDPIGIVRNAAANEFIDIPCDHDYIPPSTEEIAEAAKRLGIDPVVSEAELRRKMYLEAAKRRFVYSPISEELFALYSSVPDPVVVGG